MSSSGPEDLVFGVNGSQGKGKRQGNSGSPGLGTWDEEEHFTLKHIRDCKNKPQNYLKGTRNSRYIAD